MSTEPNRDATDVPIAIVGMSCLFPKGPGLKGYWRVLRMGVDCIGEVPSSHWSPEAWFDADPKSPDRTYCRRGGFLDPVSFDPTEFQMPPNALEATDTSQILGLVVAKAALEDAGYGEGRVFDREKTSVILGVTGCLELVIPLGARLGHPIWRRALAESGVADDVAEKVVERISGAYVPWQENSFPGLLGNVVAGRIANRLDLHGTNCVVDAACASSNSAAHLAALELAAGRADMVVTGGVDTFNDIFMYMCFSKTPALSASGECRPFSGQGDGTLLGEGIGMVVLKRLTDAERDGDRVYAVIRGIGTSSDGEGQAIYAPSSDGQKRCLERAYENAGVEPSTVGLVEAHGTGTKVGDVVEFEALRAVYGANRADTGWCALGSVKSQIGHTKAAAGAAGLIKAALALHHKVLPPTLKAEQPNPKLRLGESPFYLSGIARPWVGDPAHPRRAALSAFGFGGSNFHIVLEEHGAHRVEPAWDGSVQLVAISAETPSSLVDGLDRVAAEMVADASDEGLARIAHKSRLDFSPAHRHRLAMVIASGTDVPALIERARGVLAGETATSDVFVGEGALDGKVAFMFPGQGSQYLDMGRELACVFPEMLDALEGADAAGDEAVSRFIYPPPVPDADRDALQAALTRTDRAQPSLGAIEAGMLEVLARFGVEADLACGHSYGELVALHAARRIDAPTLHTLSRARGGAMAGLSGDRGTMAAVGGPLAEVDALIDARGLEVRLANRNAPRQAIISGSRAAVDAAMLACKEKKWAVRPLEVSAAFHSALVADARAPFRKALDTVAFPKGRFPVFANHGGGLYPDDPAASRDLLADQLVNPVDFIGMIENVYAAGARVFIEVGPRAALSGMVAAILGNRSHVRCAVDASAGRDGGLVDLARVLARCAAAGVKVDLTAWETAPPAARKKKMEVKLVGANYRAPNRSGADSVPRPPASNGKPTPVATTPAAPLAPPAVVTSAPTASPVAPPPMPVAPPPAPIVASAPTLAPTVSAPAPVAPVAGGFVAEAFRSVQSNIAALQTLQQQTAAAHQRFLEGQELAQRTFQQVLEGQQRLVERLMGGASATLPAIAAPAAPAPLPVAPAAMIAPPAPVIVPPVAPIAPVAAVAVAPAPVVAQPPVASPPPAAAPVTPADAPLAAASVGVSGERLASELLALVADKTGYPVEMLHLDMDLESDLGIDSIKRVEILAGMESRVPEAARIETDKMGSLRTLRQVVDLLGASMPATATAPAQAQDAAVPPSCEAAAAVCSAGSALASQAEALLLEVIADKTGYPREMLGLDMDLESDLGIDSIKRVEILAAMEERLPEAGRVETDRMGSLRTLRQVVEALVGEAAPPIVATPAGGGAVPSNGHVSSTPSPSPQNGQASVPQNGHSIALQVAVPTNGNGSATKNGNGASPSNGRSTAGNGRATSNGASTVQRQVLRVVDAPALAPGVPLAIAAGHEVRVTDDGEQLSAAIVDRLRSLGVASRLVPLDAVAAPGGAPCGGLVIVSPSTTAEALVDPASIAFLDRAFLAVKALAPTLSTLPGALLATVTRLDGSFGLSGGGFDAIRGGLSGLPKTAAHEWSGACLRAIDVAAESADVRADAAAVVDELSRTAPLEVGFNRGRRVVLETVAVTAQSSRHPLAPGDLVVITGGARGVTAEAAVTLAREWKPALLLLGRSPAPTAEPAWLRGLDAEGDCKKAILTHHFNGSGRPAPAELERVYREYAANREVSHTLSRLAELGVVARYVSVDVRDEAAVAAAIDAAQRDHGPVRAIIHAAGVLADKRIDEKTIEQFAAVSHTKLHGLRNLLNACDVRALRAVALFSSVTARFGRPGQVDYCMSNEALNKVAGLLARRLDGCKVVSMNWGPWDGGMVNDGLRREFGRLGVGLIPLAAGARALVAELGEAASEVEVLIGDGFPRPASPVQAGTVALEVALSLERFAFLDSHRLAGRPVVPVAMLIEWMGHAALHAHPGMRFVGIDDLAVLNGITLAGDAPLTARFVASSPRATAEGGVEIDVEVRSGDTVHARGRVALAPELPPAPRAEASVALAAQPYPTDLAGLYETRLFHGPHFHALRAIAGTSERGMTAELAPAPRPGKWMVEPLRSDWITDPLVLDGGLQMGLAWCFAQMGLPSLPTRVGRYRQFITRFPKKGVTAWLEVHGQTSRSYSGDVTFADATGKVVARLEKLEFAADGSLASAFEQGRPQKTHR